MDKKNPKELYNRLHKEGVVFFLMDDENKSNKSIEVFENINKFSNAKFIFRNLILWVNSFDKINKFIRRSYRPVLFFSKSENYFFNKDNIREKHIWKDIEWGKRKKNYNPKGKDPGNVWIRTLDDGKGHIIKYIPLCLEEVLERLILMSTNPGDNVLFLMKTSLKKFNKNKRRVIIEDE